MVSGEVLYGPATLEEGISIQVTNFGEDDLTDLGFWLSGATSVGDVDFPAQQIPEQDLQDLLGWGSDSESGAEMQGGLVVEFEDEEGVPEQYYFHRGGGSDSTNRINFGGLASGASRQFELRLEVPPGVTARRLFVQVNLE